MLVRQAAHEPEVVNSSLRSAGSGAAAWSAAVAASACGGAKVGLAVGAGVAAGLGWGVHAASSRTTKSPRSQILQET
jgi:hypothetical protein